MKNKTLKIIIIILTVATVLSVVALCGCDKPSAPMVDPIDDNYRTFYQIFVGSFSDSNGDGIGDIRGIINRMDYLNDGNINSGKSLGVQGIWLSPIFVSPSYHKYDSMNYYSIYKKFGTEADLLELIALCKDRNVKVILDLAINHTSNHHEWFGLFTEARTNGDMDNKYYDNYPSIKVKYQASESTVLGLYEK